MKFKARYGERLHWCHSDTSHDEASLHSISPLPAVVADCTESLLARVTENMKLDFSAGLGLESVSGNLYSVNRFQLVLPSCPFLKNVFGYLIISIAFSLPQLLNDEFGIHDPESNRIKNLHALRNDSALCYVMHAFRF